MLRLDLNTGRFYNTQTLELLPLGYQLKSHERVIIQGQTLAPVPENLNQVRRPTVRHHHRLMLDAVPERGAYQPIPHEFSPLTPDSPLSPVLRPGFLTKQQVKK